jgi:RHS repeat-associated protein
MGDPFPQTNPDGSEITTVRYLDGRTKLVTGSGTVSQSYTYGINPDGSQWTRTASGPNGEAWQKSTTNMLGQNVKQEQPGARTLLSANGTPSPTPLDTTLVTTQTYNNKGQLTQTQSFWSDGSTLYPLTSSLYEYNSLGEQIRSYQDLNHNNTPDLAGPDRITESESSYVLDGSDYWMESHSYLYDHGENTPTLVSTSRQRITGLGTPHPTDPAHGILVSESQSIDIHGNLSASRRYINRATRTTRTEQDSPYATTNPASVSIQVNGLLLETRNQEPETGNVLSSSYDYDALQRRVGSTDPRTGRSFVTYEATTGLVTTSTDAAGNVTTFAYDSTGRQIAVTDPLGNTTHTAYTEDGQVRAQWGATYPVVYEYDAFNRMVKLHTLRDPNTTFNPTDDVLPIGILPLSSISQLLTSVDTTTWLYDSATGLLLEKIYSSPAGGGELGVGTKYQYTPDGLLHTRTWARGVKTVYDYDILTRELTDIDYFDANQNPIPQSAIRNEYDRLGRLVETLDTFGAKTYAYNEKLQPVSELWSGAGTYTNSLTRAYDPKGRPTGFSTGGGFTVGYSYTDTGHFGSVSNFQPSNLQPVTAVYSYAPNSPMISGYTLGNLTRNVAYEANRNLVDSVTNAWNATTISAFAYTNDAAGRRTNREDSGSAFASTLTNTFGYNSKSEVTSANMRNGTSSYTFDQIGNRIQVSVPDEPNPLDYSTNALNQYEETGAPTLLSAYDLDGNLTNDGKGTTFEWNAENRMVRVTTPTKVIENTYDGQGRRVRKTVFDSTLQTLTSDTRYFYDGWNVIYEDDVLASADTKYYVWGLDLSQSLQGAGGVGGLLLVKQGTNTWAPTYDANGNISEYVNLDTGLADAHLEYDAFGRNIASTGNAPSTFGFSTKYEDIETGYLYYGFRFYDPQTGRWPNRDPIGERGGINLYGFVGNNGVAFSDRLGLSRALTGGAVKGHLTNTSLQGANRILRLIDELNAESGIQGNSCYEVIIKDMLKTNLSDIRSDVEKFKGNVYFIGHGYLSVNGQNINSRSYKFNTSWRGRIKDDYSEGFAPGYNDGGRINLNELGPDLDTSNTYGCYVSPYNRRTKRKDGVYSNQDTFDRMYRQLYGDLLKYKGIDDCKCTVKIIIYEGEIHNSDTKFTTEYVQKNHFPLPPEAKEEIKYREEMEKELKSMDGVEQYAHPCGN